MHKSEQTTCPYCGGAIDKSDLTLKKCGYCMQSLDLPVELIGGIAKLKSRDFMGAEKFLAKIVPSGSLDAYYYWFKAKHKICGEGENAVVFSYSENSFEQNEDYVRLKYMCDGTLKGDTLVCAESAREISNQKEYECSAVVFCDYEGKKDCDEFVKELSFYGYKVYKCEGFDAPQAALRYALGAYAFLYEDGSAEKLLKTSVMQNYYAYENPATQNGCKKLPFTVCAPYYKKTDGLCGECEIVPAIYAGAEARRLLCICDERAQTAKNKLYSNKSITKSTLLREGENLETEASESEINTIVKLLESGEFSEVIRRAERAEKADRHDYRLYFYAYLAYCGAHDKNDYIYNAGSTAFNANARGFIEKALCYSDSFDSEDIIECLIGCTLRLIEQGEYPLALKAIGFAFSYDYADIYAQRLIDKALGKMPDIEPEYLFAIVYKVLDKSREQSDDLRLKYLNEVIDYALGKKDGSAGYLAECALAYYPYNGELYAKKLFAVNKVNGFKELFALPEPIINKDYVYYLALCKNAAAEVKEGLTRLIANVKTVGYKNENAIAAVIEAGENAEIFKKGVFVPKDYITAGDLALIYASYKTAAKYYSKAIALDENCYKGYWGLLKAELKCSAERSLEESPEDLGTYGGYYLKAYRAAEGKDSAFIAMAETTLKRSREILKMQGHVFRKSDFVINGNTLVSYAGAYTRNVLVPEEVSRIAPDAFRGADCKSVLLSEGVFQIGDNAFAFSDIESINLPASVGYMGDNVFSGCDKLTNVECASGGKAEEDNGGVYFCGDLVSVLPAKLNGEFTVRKGTKAVRAMAFYNISGIKINVSYGVCANPCAFYGCVNCEINGSFIGGEKAYTGEGIYGDCDLMEGKTVIAEKRWISLGGDGNNLKGGTPGAFKALPSSYEGYKMISSAKISGGILYKCGNAVYAEGNLLCVSDMFGNTQKSSLGAPAFGTGVLWRQYIVQPTSTNGECVLVYVNHGGKAEYSLNIGVELTRPLCISGDYLLCVSGNECYIVNLAKGEITSTVLNESISCDPCSSAGAFYAAGENAVYRISIKGEIEKLCELNGEKYSCGEKLCGAKTVSCDNRVYWVEKGSQKQYLCVYYNGRLVKKEIITEAGDVITPPVIDSGKVYLGTKWHIMAAPLNMLGSNDCFSVVGDVRGSYDDFAVISGEPTVKYIDGECASLKLLALGGGYAFFADSLGGVFALKI